MLKLTMQVRNKIYSNSIRCACLCEWSSRPILSLTALTLLTTSSITSPVKNEDQIPHFEQAGSKYTSLLFASYRLLMNCPLLGAVQVIVTAVALAIFAIVLRFLVVKHLLPSTDASEEL